MLHLPLLGEEEAVSRDLQVRSLQVWLQLALLGARAVALCINGRRDDSYQKQTSTSTHLPATGSSAPVAMSKLPGLP